MKIGSRMMPRFDGSGNVYRWMINLDQYFESIRRLEEEWLSWIWMALDGEVCQWYVERNKPQISTFITFEKALLMQLRMSLGFIFEIIGNKTPEIWVQSKTRANKNQWDRFETDKEKESKDAAKEEVKKEGNSISKLSTKGQQSENRKT